MVVALCIDGYQPGWDLRPHIIMTPMLTYRRYLRFVSTYKDLVTINGKYNKEQICL